MVKDTKIKSNNKLIKTGKGLWKSASAKGYRKAERSKREGDYASGSCR